jgi:hypothetical protein
MTTLRSRIFNFIDEYKLSGRTRNVLGEELGGGTSSGLLLESKLVVARFTVEEWDSEGQAMRNARSLVWCSDVKPVAQAA